MRKSSISLPPHKWLPVKIHRSTLSPVCFAIKLKFIDFPTLTESDSESSFALVGGGGGRPNENGIYLRWVSVFRSLQNQNLQLRVLFVVKYFLQPQSIRKISNYTCWTLNCVWKTSLVSQSKQLFLTSFISFGSRENARDERGKFSHVQTRRRDEMQRESEKLRENLLLFFLLLVSSFSLQRPMILLTSSAARFSLSLTLNVTSRRAEELELLHWSALLSPLPCFCWMSAFKDGKISGERN